MSSSIKNKDSTQLIEIVRIIHDMAGELMNQAGGVGKNGQFINPCSKGEFLEKLLDKQKNRQKIQRLLEEVKGSELYNKTYPMVNSNLLDSKSKYLLSNSNKTYLELTLALISMENKILIELVIYEKCNTQVKPCNCQ